MSIWDIEGSKFQSGWIGSYTDNKGRSITRTNFFTYSLSETATVWYPKPNEGSILESITGNSFSLSQSTQNLIFFVKWNS